MTKPGKLKRIPVKKVTAGEEKKERLSLCLWHLYLEEVYFVFCSSYSSFLFELERPSVALSPLFAYSLSDFLRLSTRHVRLRFVVFSRPVHFDISIPYPFDKTVVCLLGAYREGLDRPIQQQAVRTWVADRYLIRVHLLSLPLPPYTPNQVK